MQNSFKRQLMLKAAAGLLALAPFSMAHAAEPSLVAISSIVDHPALNAIRDGIQDELKAKGYDDSKVKIIFQNAQGQPSIATQIARKFVGDNPAVIVAISTPSAQAAMAATKDIPIVFSAVTDPVAAKLIDDADKPGGNVTGTSDRAPLAEQIDLIKEMTPQAKTIGVIYNPGEANSVVSISQFKEIAAQKGYKVVDGPATKSADVQAAARSLVGKADVIYVPTDNTIISALESAIRVTNNAKIPLYTGDTDSVMRGAIASLGFNYYDMGKQTGDQVIAILEGQKISDLPVRYGKGSELYLNSKTAKTIGLVIPEDLLKKAKKNVE
ncbi:ABC transporter substrate-binding protein [Microvirga sp. W0021]|uniref:ABC transporter substrate-binding protein n=1 Tax=Hohaiivirga grylli TaxID=3133970 RepID=A0ABV0BI66_9HYPH